jgi:hypothetical protein
MSDGALKPEKDFSKEADKQIAEAETLAKVRSKALVLQYFSRKKLTWDAMYRAIFKRQSRSSPASRSKRAR